MPKYPQKRTSDESAPQGVLTSEDESAFNTADSANTVVGGQ